MNEEMRELSKSLQISLKEVGFWPIGDVGPKGIHPLPATRIHAVRVVLVRYARGCEGNEEQSERVGYSLRLAAALRAVVATLSSQHSLRSFQFGFSLQLYGVQFESIQSASLVMELCPGSLEDAVRYSNQRNLPLSLATKAAWLLQIARAVAFLHHQNPPIVHGSLCPSNVLLTSSLVPRLTDIGMGLLERLLYDRSYSGEFVAPEEQSVEATSSVAGDVFSMGKLILYVAERERCEK